MTGMMAFVRDRRRPKAQLGRDVRLDVTMKQPVADTLRRPRHRHRGSRLHELRHDVRLLASTEPLIAQSVPEAVHLEIEAVHVHRVRLR